MFEIFPPGFQKGFEEVGEWLWSFADEFQAMSHSAVNEVADRLVSRNLDAACQATHTLLSEVFWS